MMLVFYSQRGNTMGIHSKGHTLRVRPDRWREIEKKAWKLSQELDGFVKPTEVADLMLQIGIKEITLEDIIKARK